MRPTESSGVFVARTAWAGRRYWPFGGRTKAETTEYTRGERREAYTALPSHSRLGYLKAELWLDATWVTMLATSYFSAGTTTVLRWTAEAFARLPRNCSATLARYAKMMGCVDRFNRSLAATNMAMGRCKQRYHRALFLGWLLPAVGVLNVMVVFMALLTADELAELKKARHCATLGFSRWFQQKLGEALIKHGVSMAKADIGSPNTRGTQGLAPRFMPRSRQLRPIAFEVYTFPQNHKQVLRSKVAKKNTAKRVKLPSNNQCRRCSELAQRDGFRDWYHTDGRTPSKTNVMVTKMPDGKNIPRTSYACNVCKVWLCKHCFRMEDKHGNGHPERWDHINQCLLARSVVTD